jgi:hypothetical protein
MGVSRTSFAAGSEHEQAATSQHSEKAAGRHEKKEREMK